MADEGPTGLRRHPRTRQVSTAHGELGLALDAFQSAHGLTEAEMLLGVHAWVQDVLRGFLREERHPGEPEKKADER